MIKEYWNRIAPEYESQVFDVYSNDKKKLIIRLVKKFGDKNAVASDIGCGTGRFLPLLSGAFKKVYAVDISQKLIRRAEKINLEHGNISFQLMDMSSPGLKLPSVDFALSVNAFLDPSPVRRNRMLKNVVRHLTKGAFFLMVTPSLESKLLTDFRLIEWNLRKGMKETAALSAGSDKNNRIESSTLQGGIVRIDGVRTKHYLKEELITELESCGMEILQIKKIEYPWNIEFDKPPRWMQAPFPWDWLFLSKKVRNLK